MHAQRNRTVPRAVKVRAENLSACTTREVESRLLTPVISTFATQNLSACPTRFLRILQQVLFLRVP